MLIIPDETGSLSYEAYDFAEDIYPKAHLFDTAGNEITTVNLTHAGNGTYIGAYTPDGTYPYIRVSVIVYTTSARTTKNESYPIKPDEIVVKRFAATMAGGRMPKIEYMPATPEDLEKLEKKLLEKIEEVKDEVDKKSEFDVKEDVVKIPDQKRPSFKLDREAIIKEIKNIELKDYSKVLTEIKAELIKKPNKIPPADKTDLTELLDKIENIINNKIQNIISQFPKPIDNNKDVLEAIKKLPVKYLEIDWQPIIKAINKMKEAKKKDRDLTELLENLKTILTQIDDYNVQRFWALAKIIKEKNVKPS